MNQKWGKKLQCNRPAFRFLTQDCRDQGGEPKPKLTTKAQFYKIKPSEYVYGKEYSMNLYVCFLLTYIEFFKSIKTTAVDRYVDYNFCTIEKSSWEHSN